MNRRQKHGESFEQYFSAVTDMNSKMRVPRCDGDLIKIMKRHVNSILLLFLHGCKTSNLTEFLKEGRNTNGE